MQRLRHFLPILILIAIGVGLFFSGALDRFRPDNLAHEQAVLQAQIAEHPLLAWLSYLGAVVLVVATGIPAGGAVLIVTGGMLFGIVVGTLLSTAGIVIGALILFFASRHAFGDHSHAQAPELVQRLRGGYAAHPISYTAFLRLVPFFPFGGVTVALAWLRCPLWLFVAATAGGGGVMACVEVSLGAGLARSIGEQQKVSLDVLAEPRVFVPLVAMALLALTPIVIAKVRARFARDERAAGPTNP
jgi:uncharacterized membrane protein YdjX (TVP38/TMEM64 family)